MRVEAQSAAPLAHVPHRDTEVQLQCCRAFLTMSMSETLRPRLLECQVAEAVKVSIGGCLP